MFSASIFSWLWLTRTPALCPKLKVSTYLRHFIETIDRFLIFFKETNAVIQSRRKEIAKWSTRCNPGVGNSYHQRSTSLLLCSTAQHNQTVLIMLGCQSSAWVERRHYLICCCHLISPVLVPVTLATAISFFCLEPHCLPPPFLFSLSQGQPPSFFPLPFLSLPLSLPSSLPLSLPLSPSLSICWESLRQLRSDTAALQTKEGASRSTSTYLLFYTLCKRATLSSLLIAALLSFS